MMKTERTYFGVLLVIWAVVLVCGQSFSLYGKLWQPGSGGLLLALGGSLLAVVAAVVMWPLSCAVIWSSVGVLGWNWDAHQLTLRAWAYILDDFP